MRIKEKVANIDYSETRQFFKNRAQKFQEDNPYSVTMYQDNNKELVQERNKKEVGRILPMLQLDERSRVLDIACGIGRWADALPGNIAEYCGVDFSSELIKIARERNTREKFSFIEGPANEVEQVLRHAGKGTYNTILLMGIMIYLNDEDILSVLEQVGNICEEHALICVREPVGIEERLTLKDFFSDELKDNYNAIYRTRRELGDFYAKTLFKKGFRIAEEGFLFEEEALNNRKETSQYFYILRR